MLFRSPEVIRELELPKYDLEIIPLDSTFTPLADGDYLFRCGDHSRTRREIARHSVTDAEAYEQYGQLMVQMAMAVKPLLGMIPPEPTTWNPKDLFGLARVGNDAADRAHASTGKTPRAKRSVELAHIMVQQHVSCAG